jgi:hypothetical protein
MFFFQTEQSDVIFINLQTFHVQYSRCVKRVFHSAFVRKCTDMRKHRFGMQLLQNPPLCSSTVYTYTVCKGGYGVIGGEGASDR